MFLGIAGVLVAFAAFSYATNWRELVMATRRPPYEMRRTGPRREIPGPAGALEKLPESQMKGLSGAKEVLGNPQAPVKVWALVAPVRCWNPAVELLRAMHKKHPNELYVEMYNMASPEGAEERTKHKGCAGIEINGASKVPVVMADGTEREVTLQKSPGQLYALEDLQRALEQAVKKAQKGGAAEAKAGA